MSITTSAAYKTAIKADTETTNLEATFGFYPDGSAEGSSVTASEEASISRLAQVNDGAKQMSAKWAEFGRWSLDGTFDLIDPENANQQVGFWSSTRSGEDGSFADPKPYINYIMDAEYDIIGATLFFDTACNEYATSITLQYYGDTDSLIAESTFANDLAIAGLEYPATGVKRIKAILNSWSRPNAKAKVCEMLPGETFVFDADNTMSFEYTESVSPFESSITLPEFTVEFDNSKKKFDVVNPAGLMAYLRGLMKVLSQIGILTGSVFEYVSTGNFYVYSWPDATQEDTAQLVCKPLLAFKENITYIAPGTGTQTVAAAAAVIFGAAGITNYTVDSSLASIVVNQYIGDNVPLINAAGQLAIAAGGYWKIGRDDSYSLVPWAMPVATNSTDYDNMWEKPEIEQSKKITQVNVKHYYYSSVYDCVYENDNIITAATNDGTAADDICSGFIHSSERAAAVGALALNYYAMRLNYGVTYRGDMSIEAGDAVTIENDYADQNVFITEHNITWDIKDKLGGTLKGVAPPA